MRPYIQRVRRRQRAQTDHALHQAGDAPVELRGDGVDDAPGLIGQADALKADREGPLDPGGAGGNREREVVGAGLPRLEAVRAQRALDGVDLRARRAELLGELCRGDVVAVEARARG